MLFLSSQNNIHLFSLSWGLFPLFNWNLSIMVILILELRAKICVPHKWLKRSHLILQDRKSQACHVDDLFEGSWFWYKYISSLNFSVSSICMHATRWDHMWAHLCRTLLATPHWGDRVSCGLLKQAKLVWFLVLHFFVAYAIPQESKF